MATNPFVTPGQGPDPIQGSMQLKPGESTQDYYKRFPSSAPGAPVTGTQTGATSGMNLGVFATAMNEMRGKLGTNNDLTEQKRKLITQLYDRPLTPDEMNTLSPSQSESIRSNNRGLVDMELRLINDEIKGRKDTLDSSIKYLTDTYQKQQETSDAQYNKSVDIITNFVKEYGSSAPDAIKKLYGQDFIDKLKSQGINIDTLGTLPKSLAEIKAAGLNTGGVSVMIPSTSTLAFENNNPGNLKYANQENASLGSKGYAKFKTSEEGFQALIDQIDLDKSRDLTIEQFVTKYAPPTENNTEEYITQMEGQFGLPRNTSINNIDSSDMAQFISKKESGAEFEEIKSDIQMNAQALIEGMPLSMLAKRGAEYNKIIAEAKRLARKQGTTYDPTKAMLQYKAAETFVKNQNSAQNNRMRGLAESVVNTITEVNTLAEGLNQIGITKFNEVSNAVNRNLYGNTDKGQLVSQYLAAVNTLKEEFANLANGGYAPTDAAWDLANSQINANYGVKQLSSSLIEVQRLINFRVNAIINLQAIGGMNSTSTETNKPSIESFIVQ